MAAVTIYSDFGALSKKRMLRDSLHFRSMIILSSYPSTVLFIFPTKRLSPFPTFGSQLLTLLVSLLELSLLLQLHPLYSHGNVSAMEFISSCASGKGCSFPPV